jgi:hypothetical protein
MRLFFDGLHCHNLPSWKTGQAEVKQHHFKLYIHTRYPKKGDNFIENDSTCKKKVSILSRAIMFFELLIKRYYEKRTLSVNLLVSKDCKTGWLNKKKFRLPPKTSLSNIDDQLQVGLFFI